VLYQEEVLWERLEAHFRVLGVPWEQQVAVLRAVLWGLSERLSLQVGTKLAVSQVLLEHDSQARLSIRLMWDRCTAEV
jgi:hypothetical protein